MNYLLIILDDVRLPRQLTFKKSEHRSMLTSIQKSLIRIHVYTSLDLHTTPCTQLHYNSFCYS